MLFQKKSTKELVHGGVDETATPETENKRKRWRWLPKEKVQAIGGQASFFRTKLFWGISCIALGLIVTLVGIPMLRAQVVSTSKILRFSADAHAGTIITADMITSTEVSSYHLPNNTLTDQSEVVGKYLRCDAVAGDYVTAARLSADYPGDDPYLLDIPEGKMAISIPLPELAQSVSGKLRAADIIQIFSAVANSEAQIADAPPELQYVEVLSATYPDGADVGQKGSNTVSSAEREKHDDTIATVTILVNSRQAATVAGLQKQATLYAALVIRGNDARKDAALAAQDAYFAALEPSPEIATGSETIYAPTETATTSEYLNKEGA